MLLINKLGHLKGIALVDCRCERVCVKTKRNIRTDSQNKHNFPKRKRDEFCLKQLEIYIALYNEKEAADVVGGAIRCAFVCYFYQGISLPQSLLAFFIFKRGVAAFRLEYVLILWRLFVSTDQSRSQRRLRK